MRENGPIEGFESMSVEDQVLALKNVLPEEVVQNRKVYRVLSKGIHQLDEDECLAHYNVMHAAIVEILERDIYDQQRAKTSADLRKAVADVVGKVGATKRPAAERPQ